MKLKIFFILICNLMICNLQFSQNITNTLGTNGLFTIKNGATTFFTLSQSNGTLDLLKSINIRHTSNADTNSGVIRKNGIRFIHNFQNSTDAGNTFMGLYSGNFSLMNTGMFNTGIGHSAFF